MIDCMIAAVAWRSGATVLACEAGFGRVAELVGVELDQAPSRA
jgi:predicted nucleic acid-binding protein